MPLIRITILFIVFLPPLQLFAQRDSLSFEEQFAQLEAEMDSLSVFFLIDSILNTPKQSASEFNVRLSYNNNMLTTGRSYGISQQSLAPGVSFYHKSGIYADYSGFIYTESDPVYNLSMFSAGYLGTIGKKWSYNANYEHWLYHEKDTENSLNNSIGISTTFNTKYGYASIDYSFLFGNEIANRVISNITGKIPLGKFWIFDRVNLLPSVTIIFGNADITLYQISESDRNRRLLKILQLDREDILKLYENGVIGQGEMREFLRTRRLQSSGELTPEQEERLEEILKSLQQEKKVFGLMNYSFSLPLVMSTKKFSFLVSYSYSIPVALPGENFSMDPVGYLGASVTYRIPLKD